MNKLQKRIGLGILKGLDDIDDNSILQNLKEDQVVTLPVQQIKPHPKNHLYFKDLDRKMKDKLMEDMRDHGLINPIIVLRNGDSTYTVLAGHQRLIAAKRLNWQDIKTIIVDMNEEEAEKLLIRDNLFRRHMGGIELAHALDAYSKLSDNQTKSIRQIADEIGENRNTVHFYMKLNKLIPELQQLVAEEKLTPTAAQAFTSMDEDEQRQMYEVLGQRIYGLKKKEIEEHIRQQYEEKLQKSKKIEQEAKQLGEQISTLEQQNSRLSQELINKDKDVYTYKSQIQGYREKLNKKEAIANMREESHVILARLELVRTIVDEIGYSWFDVLPLEELKVFEQKLESLISSITDALNEIKGSIGEKNENGGVE